MSCTSMPMACPVPLFLMVMVTLASSPTFISILSKLFCTQSSGFSGAVWGRSEDLFRGVPIFSLYSSLTLADCSSKISAMVMVMPPLSAPRSKLLGRSRSRALCSSREPPTLETLITTSPSRIDWISISSIWYLSSSMRSPI